MRFPLFTSRRARSQGGTAVAARPSPNATVASPSPDSDRQDFDPERARLLVAWYGAQNLSLAVNAGQICCDGHRTPSRDPRSGVVASRESVETARKFFDHLAFARAVDKKAPTRENSAQLALLEDIYTAPRRDIVAEFLDLAAQRPTPHSRQVEAVAYEIGAELNLTQLDVLAIVAATGYGAGADES
ncbi:hypothetical protein [Rhodococcus erythropolis]|uniref:Uncharacterized protein n=1 Tax=Rhodococcus erythropolis (strain PR4 / NBRC 100887) TaxID=234621 RepID=Q3L8Y4_RHOE4|nr:hypothetical protein [Rhodococcus erythropolis]BAE46329.1 hypothetical protein RER_pREC1-00880 [Rhodococcus erythropolis PR4]